MTTRPDGCCKSPSAGPVEGLRERDQAILCELARGDDAQVGFQGLRRRLDLHQEALRRSLGRLERDGYVRRHPHGYGLTPKGSAVFEGDVSRHIDRRTTPVAQVILPADLDAVDLVDSLSRRWFRGLRWYGLTQGPGETTLMWETEPEGGLVRLRVGVGTATAEVAAAPDE